MKDRIEIILRFRRIISTRYVVYGIILGLIILSGIVLQLFLLKFNWMKSISSGLVWVGLGFLWYLLHHRYLMLSHFSTLNEDAAERLENYLKAKQKKWFDLYLAKMGGMCLLALIMLMLLFFWRESVWTGIVTSLFITLLLAMIFKGWMDFNDELLLQDIKHSIRDQTSE